MSSTAADICNTEEHTSHDLSLRVHSTLHPGCYQRISNRPAAILTLARQTPVLRLALHDRRYTGSKDLDIVLEEGRRNLGRVGVQQEPVEADRFGAQISGKLYRIMLTVTERVSGSPRISTQPIGPDWLPRSRGLSPILWLPSSPPAGWICLGGRKVPLAMWCSWRKDGAKCRGSPTSP